MLCSQREGCYLVAEGGDKSSHTAGQEGSIWLQHQVRRGSHNYPACLITSVDYQNFSHTVTREGGILDVNSLEPPARPEYCRGYEGADGGGEEGDVSVDVSPEHNNHRPTMIDNDRHPTIRDTSR